LKLDTTSVLTALATSLSSSDALSVPTISPSPSLISPVSTESAYLVTRVIDGDTIEVSLNGQVEKVRLIGVDTPETVDPRKTVQCFGKEASARTKELLTGKTVTLVKDVSETDRYHRWLRYVYLDGVFINQQLVLEGYAHARSYPPDVKYQAEFRAAEEQAREQKKGMWAEGVCS
jgi:micrococcal nuclease